MDKKREEGSVLVISLLVSIVILILLGVFSGSIIAERKRQERSYRSLRALNLAEAGVEMAIWELNNGDMTKWDEDEAGDPVSSFTIKVSGKTVGDSKVTVTSPGDTTVVQATGYVPEINIAIERRVEKGVEVHLTYYKGSFEYAIVGRSKLKLEGDETFVTGDLYCMGSISNEGVTVDGWGYATGTITITEGGTFTDIEEGVEPISFPVVDFADYESQATVSGDVFDELTVTDNPNFEVPEVLYVRGDFKAVRSTLVRPGIIPGIIVAEGTIKLDNSTCGASGVPVGLISASSNSTEAIKVETNSDVHGVLYAPFGGIKVESGSTVYGCIIGGEGVGVEVKIETGGRVIYQNYYDLLNLPPVPGSELYTFERWRGK